MFISWNVLQYTHIYIYENNVPYINNYKKNIVISQMQSTFFGHWWKQLWEILIQSCRNLKTWLLTFLFFFEQVTCFTVHENFNFMAVGFENGTVILYKGDVTRDRWISYFMNFFNAFWSSLTIAIKYISVICALSIFQTLETVFFKCFRTCCI